MKRRQPRWVLAGLGLWILTLWGCGDPTAVVVELLRVVNWSPAHGAVCVATDTTVLATFSDDLKPASFSADTFYVEDASGVLEITPTYDAATFTASLEPSEPLSYGATFTVVAATGLQGKKDGALTTDLKAAFQTVVRGGCGAAIECTLASECTSKGTGLVCSTDGKCVACGNEGDCLFAYGVGFACMEGVCTQQ